MQHSCPSCAISDSLPISWCWQEDRRKCAGREESCRTRGSIPKDRKEEGFSAVCKCCSLMLTILLLEILPWLAWPPPSCLASLCLSPP